MIMHTSTNQTEAIILPLAPETEREEMDRVVYSRFIGHMQHVPNGRKEIKILSSIQFTADMMGHSDAHIAKILVDMGLRAPRMAFPVDFLEFADASLMRSGWEVGGPSAALLDLKAYWDRTGEDKFAGFKRRFCLLEDCVRA